MTETQDRQVDPKVLEARLARKLLRSKWATLAFAKQNKAQDYVQFVLEQGLSFFDETLGVDRDDILNSAEHCIKKLSQAFVPSSNWDRLTLIRALEKLRPKETDVNSIDLWLIVYENFVRGYDLFKKSKEEKPKPQKGMKRYAFVRSDLTTEQKVVQLAHACLCAKSNVTEPLTTLVLFEATLEQIVEVRKNLKFKSTVFYDPKLHKGITALVTNAEIETPEHTEYFSQFNLYKA